MIDLTLPAMLNTSEIGIVMPLAPWADIYPLSDVMFLARVCDEKGGATKRYEWKTGGSDDFPNSVLSYEPTSKVIVMRAISEDALKAFPPALLSQRTKPFVWELGFYLPGFPDNMIGIGIGSFPVENGVIV